MPDRTNDPGQGALGVASQASKSPFDESLYAAFDHTPLAVTITALDDGRLLHVNEGFVRLSGFSRDEAVGRTTDELRLWVDPQVRTTGLERLRAGQSLADIEARFRMKDGTQRVGVIGSALVNIGGRTCALSTVIDITDRKEAEQALRAREADARRLLALNETILANMGEGMYAVDQHGLVTYMNAEAARLFGWTHAEVLGRQMHELTHFKHPDGSPFPIEECAGFNVLHEGKALKDFEDVFIRRDGTFFPVSYSSSPLRDDEGRIVGLVVVFQDITERQRAAKALQESREELATELAAARRLQAVSTGLVREDTISALCEQLLDASRQIMGSDFASIQMFDANRDELRLLGHRGFTPEAERYWSCVYSASETSGGAALRLRERVIVPDLQAPEAPPGNGHFAMFAKTGIRAIQSTPLMSRAGHLLGVLSTHWRVPYQPPERDLRLLDVLARQAGDLIERVRAEEKMRESEEHLRRANQMKDEFLATLSHELRTPLNAVLGWAHMLRTGTLRPDVAERALESLERNARAQAQLVEDLLDVSRIVSGKLQIKNERVDLSAVIAAAVETVRPAADARRVTLQVTADPDRSIAVQGDSDRLRQVVWNLLSNAVKFTPAEGLVSVTLTHLDGQAEVIVRDTGEGIGPEFLPFVFERFRQADGTTTRKHAGLGLGLAIVRHLTEAHGGTVTAHSHGPKAGATFTLSLPLVSSADVEGLIEPLPVPSLAALQGVRILVVDDEPDARELLRVILESAGAAVALAASAEDALVALRKKMFDVLVADIAMPGRDGYALLRDVRALPTAAARIPAIAVTAQASAADRERAATVGFTGHVPKPVDPTRLVHAVAVQASAVR